MALDYYRILDVDRQASLKDIKSAFRKKAKEQHPDTASGDNETARNLITAYKTLANPQLRREYDRSHYQSRFVRPIKDGFDYRVWLKERIDIVEYKAKLVFFDLLHGYEDEALLLYEELVQDDAGRMERFFERTEAMDAEFCLAEELIQRKRFVDAYRVLCKLVRMEQQKPGFGYFYEVVLLQFRRLILEKLSQVLTESAFLEILDQAISLHSTDENDAWFYRRKAEILSKNGETFLARQCEQLAIKLHPAFLKTGRRKAKPVLF